MSNPVEEFIQIQRKESANIRQSESIVIQAMEKLIQESEPSA